MAKVSPLVSRLFRFSWRGRKRRTLRGRTSELICIGGRINRVREGRRVLAGQTVPSVPTAPTTHLLSQGESFAK